MACKCSPPIHLRVLIPSSATYFYQNGNADQTRFGTSGPSSPLCGLQVQITNTNNGNSITVTIADDCPTCKNEDSIDLSVGAFEALSDLSFLGATYRQGRSLTSTIDAVFALEAMFSRPAFPPTGFLAWARNEADMLLLFMSTCRVAIGYSATF
ncbi:hypothetical protein JVU11DRAFT_782 [Chiua virens]|nr:hypothetical protein JVU11DRAFT_782 [Chiua virens]